MVIWFVVNWFYWEFKVIRTKRFSKTIRFD